MVEKNYREESEGSSSMVGKSWVYFLFALEIYKPGSWTFRQISQNDFLGKFLGFERAPQVATCPTHSIKLNPTVSVVYF